MERVKIIEKIGTQYHTTNIENGEWSYVKDAGSKVKLKNRLPVRYQDFTHFELDIRFECEGVSVLVETKQKQTDADIEQLKEYYIEEKELHLGNKIICILADTKGDKIRVWKNGMDEKDLLKNEKVIDTMEHYVSLFEEEPENDRLMVLYNTNKLNELLHKKDIDEKLRSQFVGTTLLYIQDKINKSVNKTVDENLIERLNKSWINCNPSEIIGGIKGVLNDLLNERDDSKNKEIKIQLLQKNVLQDQKVKKLSTEDWIEILDFIIENIYKYINQNSAEGQDILNLFFIAFNKYTGKADKNQAFTPDHITEFMCEVTGVDKDKRVFDGTCGSGSFLVQAMVKELRDCDKAKVDEKEKKKLRRRVVKENIYGIEVEEKAYGLATTNMLIHGDGNSNIIKASIFDKEGKEFIKKADPDIILMNPPYNAKPITLPKSYMKDWGVAKDGKEDPSKGLIFIQYVSDCIKELNTERKKKDNKEVKMAVLLPVSVAVGTGSLITEMKSKILEDNTLEAVFTLPNEIFYPGASASACCMVFTLGKPHFDSDGKIRQKTYFGYYKDDAHKKKKNLGRVEQFEKGTKKSFWKEKEKKWLDYYKNKTVEDGFSAMQEVDGEKEWLCEAYMKTDYSTLKDDDFQKTLNSYLSYLVKEGKLYES